MHRPHTRSSPTPAAHPGGRRGPSHRLGPAQTAAASLWTAVLPTHSHTGTSPLTRWDLPTHTHTGTSPLTHRDLPTHSHTHRDLPTHTPGPPHSPTHTGTSPLTHSDLLTAHTESSTPLSPARPSSRPLPGTVSPPHPRPSHQGLAHRAPPFCQPHGQVSGLLRQGRQRHLTWLLSPLPKSHPPYCLRSALTLAASPEPLSRWRRGRACPPTWPPLHTHPCPGHRASWASVPAPQHLRFQHINVESDRQADGASPLFL